MLRRRVKKPSGRQQIDPEHVRAQPAQERKIPLGCRLVPKRLAPPVGDQRAISYAAHCELVRTKAKKLAVHRHTRGGGRGRNHRAVRRQPPAV
jgi:hypothetical protein